jgi:glycosyltransferase involved in cell wall biosynthesis
MPEATKLGDTLGIASFPAVSNANPYQRLLYERLGQMGFHLERDARFKLRWLVGNRRNVSVLHFHWPQTYYVWEGSIIRLRAPLSWIKLGVFATRLAIARALRYRIIWTVHQVHPHETASPPLDRLGALVLARAADKLIVHDQSTAERAAASFGSAGEAVVIPHGSYIGVYRRQRSSAAMREELRVPEHAFVFLYFGQVRGYKAVEELLRAFSDLSDTRVRLVVAGSAVDGDEEAAVRAAARQDTRIVPLIGFVHEERVADLYGAADAVILSRTDGGTSGSLILALSLGRPVVVGNTPTYRKLIGEGRAGWIFDPSNRRSLTETLALAASSREEAGVKGEVALAIAETLDWNDIAARTAEVMAKTGGRESERADVLLVCSAGGHLLQMLALRPAWADFSHCWVTLDRSDSRSLLRREKVVYAHGPTHRNLKNLVRNTLLAWRIIGRTRPRLILTTGAALAVPFAWIGRLRGVETLYVESVTRIEQPSLSCRLIAPAASRVYAQWPELTRALPQSRYAGTVISSK